MEEFQNNFFQTTFHHLQAKNCYFRYRFHFEGKNDGRFTAIQCVKEDFFFNSGFLLFILKSIYVSCTVFGAQCYLGVASVHQELVVVTDRSKQEQTAILSGKNLRTRINSGHHGGMVQTLAVAMQPGVWVKYQKFRQK